MAYSKIVEMGEIIVENSELQERIESLEVENIKLHNLNCLLRIKLTELNDMMDKLMKLDSEEV